MRNPLPAAYTLVERSPGTILLEGAPSLQFAASSQLNEKPWTRLFTAPLRVCTARSSEEMPALFAQIEEAVAKGLFAAGFFTYECGAAFERKAAMRPPRTGMPLAWFGIYDRAHVPEVAGQGSGARDQGSEIRDREPAVRTDFALTEPEYALRIDAIHELIRRGDVYQLNFTAPLRLRAAEDPAALYARLRSRQPARYGAFLHWQQDRRILSFSPELFFRIDGDGASRRIVTRPMKGTAPRGRTTREDGQIAEWLRQDAKNRSENLMIVDLLRNDLGRIARFGTVRAEQLFTVERLPTVWQMTSTVNAELRPGMHFEEIFRALFPCGSITGAPKVRAMQLIAELEDGPRGVYTGAIGFFSREETIFNVAIRTMELEDGLGTMGVGSGIVIDSDPAGEYRECLLKAEFLTRSSEQHPREFSLIETMLWEGCFPLLALHLDRLADSADYFGFLCERAAIEAALLAHAQQFSVGERRRVRLLLSIDGKMEIADQPLVADETSIQRVCISAQHTDPADIFLYHKTTHRPLYGPALEAAMRHSCADALFFNTRGELTEGAISNVFVVKDGHWLTPPIGCGLLAGVYRRHLLESRPEIEERVLREEDLRGADAVYIGNAVRGLRKVVVEGR